MIPPVQDDYYLRKEADDFFTRNFEGKDLPELRANKKELLAFLAKANIPFQRVLEYGCNFGDMLAHFQREGKEAHGVEPSAKAIAYGRSRWGDKIHFHHGTMSRNPLADGHAGKFDLIVIEDVFGWVARETIFASVASVDALLAEGGHLYLRDFYPDKMIKVRNHHVKDADVYNFKVLGSHASLFAASGCYQVVEQEVFYDRNGSSRNFAGTDGIIYRWTDVLLRKSTLDHFLTVGRN